MSSHPESRWTHPVCDDCWYADHHTELHVSDDAAYVIGPIQVEVPSRLVSDAREWEQCCRCGCMTFSGIFVRADPNDDEYKHWCMESDIHQAARNG